MLTLTLFMVKALIFSQMKNTYTRKHIVLKLIISCFLRYWYYKTLSTQNYKITYQLVLRYFPAPSPSVVPRV